MVIKIVALAFVVWMVVVTIHRLKTKEPKGLIWMWGAGVFFVWVAFFPPQPTVSRETTKPTTTTSAAAPTAEQREIARRHGLPENEVSAVAKGICNDPQYRADYPSDC